MYGTERPEVPLLPVAQPRAIDVASVTKLQAELVLPLGPFDDAGNFIPFNKQYRPLTVEERLEAAALPPENVLARFGLMVSADVARHQKAGPVMLDSTVLDAEADSETDDGESDEVEEDATKPALRYHCAVFRGTTCLLGVVSRN